MPFSLLGDLIFLRYCIILCDNCVLVLLLLECILPLCFRTLILTCTDTQRIYVRYFRPAHIRRSNVSVPVGSRRYKHPERFDIYSNVSQTSLQSPEFFETSWRLYPRMARIFSGSRCIPLDVTTNPRNLPLATPSKDLIGFIFSWCARMMSNTFFRSARWLPLSRLFTAISYM